MPNRVVAVVKEGDDLKALARLVPLVAEKAPLRGKPTAYVCEQRVCELPTTDPAVFARQIASVRRLDGPAAPADAPATPSGAAAPPAGPRADSGPEGRVPATSIAVAQADVDPKVGAVVELHQVLQEAARRQARPRRPSRAGR